MASSGGKIRNLFEALDTDDQEVIDLLYRKTFQVVELSRYYPDSRSRSYYGFNDCQFWDLFDITLADGRNRRKFVASADTVREHMVYTGSSIKLKQVERFWDLTEDGRVAVVVVRDLDVWNSEKCFKVSEKLAELPMVPKSYSSEEEKQPLASSRLYYMDNWTFNLATGQRFGDDVKCVPLQDIDLSAVCQIKDIVHKKSTRAETSCLLVKVVRKSRLIHYVARHKDEKWPFQVVHIYKKNDFHVFFCLFGFSDNNCL
ncbi:hypothetical protein EGW08_000788 [Elysia chlorotica]|uniref:Uncharacterized protein n=1 Tax=Elysia chlorotica TaxID=188477 RepID=A0A433UCI2_ELYCH|nr:hypothetical protein EGW08_000788 [Elysia chlorotica]